MTPLPLLLTLLALPQTPAQPPAISKVAPTGGRQAAVPSGLAAAKLWDQAGGLLEASSTPTLGMLYPISDRLFVHPQLPLVGIGTTTPSATLEVFGTMEIGSNNYAGGPFSSVLGGTGNRVENGSLSSIAGGADNTVGAVGWGSVGGGRNNTVTGSLGTIPGGVGNTAHTKSFAAGDKAQAIHVGCFVWSDDSDAFNPLTTTADRQFLIRAAGGVGIGTATPTGALDVAGSIRSTGPAGGAVTATNPSNSGASVTLGWLNDVARLRIGGSGAGAQNGFDFQTVGNASLMRILGNGRVGIGTNAPAVPLHVDGGTDLSISGGGFLVLGDVGAGNIGFDNNEIMARTNGVPSTLYLNHNGGDVLLGAAASDNVGIGTASPSARLDVNGTVKCTSLIQTSDARLKRDVRELEGVLDVVRDLRGVSFTWDPELLPEAGDGRQVGFLAQEVREVLPEAVVEDEQGTLAVAYSQVVPVLVEALQEQDRLMTEMQRELDELRRLVTSR